jgi:hypothetical protein
MKTDNFDIISSFLDFSEPEKFYLLNIIQRKKDIPSLDKSTRLIKTYGIDSIDALYRNKQEITGLCEYFGARAAIYINRRSYKITAGHMLKSLTDSIISGNYYGIKHLFTSEAAAHGCGDKNWIIDIDLIYNDGERANLSDFYEPYKLIDGLSNSLYDYMKCIGPCNENKIIGTIPTAHGWHIVTRPFDTRELDGIREKILKFFSPFDFHGDMELKKDAMLNLYIP